MRSKVITSFRKLRGIGKEGGLTDFVMYGRAVAFQRLDRRQIERTMKRCINLNDYDFTPREATEHFFNLSRLALPKKHSNQKVGISHG